MNLVDLYGTVAVFTPVADPGDAALEAKLSPRNRRLLVAAANFHALENPGVHLDLRVYLAGSDKGPRLTDISTKRAPVIESTLIGTWQVLSAGSSVHSSAATGPAPRRVSRHIVLAEDGPQTESGGLPRRANLYWGARQKLEQRFPTQYDNVRHLLLARRERKLKSHLIPRAVLQPTSARWLTAAPPAVGARRAVLFGVHWLEMGGAERWAVEAVRAARDAGLLPIVITGRESFHPWITRSELDGALVLPLTYPLEDADEDEKAGSEPLLRALLENFDIAGVFVHHAQWLYDRLPWIRNSRPGIPVIDSLHIVEYAGGGYPASGVHLDNFIDLHHVISPHLEQWMAGEQQVDRAKLVMAPLVELTGQQRAESEFRPRQPGVPFTIAFLGRFVRQKRPYLYLQLVQELVRRGVPVRAILQGGGELDGDTRRRVESYGLGGVVEFRDHDFSVDQTLSETDCLVISSQNEGLTLTTLEAIAAGVPVISTDVGSQSTLISAPQLAPRRPKDFVASAADEIVRLATDEAARRAAWQDQFDRAKQFSLATPASEWVEGVLASWRR